MIAPFKIFVDSWQELKQVNWLTRKQVIASTWLVILLVIVFSIYIGLVDYIISILFSRMIRS
jgi:preprotein translocase subunit SecE